MNKVLMKEKLYQEADRLLESGQLNTEEYTAMISSIEEDYPEDD
jgi:hypothetical protein